MRSSAKVICSAFFWGALSFAGVGNAGAEEEWQGRFETLCSLTGEVMNLSPEKLQTMLDECESFRPKIEALPESPRKIYRKRLTLSCNLVRFAFEEKRALLQKD